MTAMVRDSKDLMLTIIGVPALAVAATLVGASLFGWGIIVLSWFGLMR
ncbi:MAG: hypothetical protein H7841_01240 [Magnetospirillum sp. WYHS-4]